MTQYINLCYSCAQYISKKNITRDALVRIFAKLEIMCSPSNFKLLFVYVTIILIKRERRKLYHFTSSSGVTDINALHDAYGAYVQFSAFRSLFVINPCIFLLIYEHFLTCLSRKRERAAFSLFLVFCERRMKNHHKKSNRNLVKAHTHHTMLRKIAQTSVSRHAQMRNALANGSMVRVSRSHASLYFYTHRFFFSL